LIVAKKAVQGMWKNGGTTEMSFASTSRSTTGWNKTRVSIGPFKETRGSGDIKHQRMEGVYESGVNLYIPLSFCEIVIEKLAPAWLHLEGFHSRYPVNDFMIPKYWTCGVSTTGR
jgi:hypothetical protein